MESRENIQNNIEDWVLFNLGESFKFREHQKEIIIDIIDNIVNDTIEGDNKCQIIEAPTGSGKSLINIISAGVLSEYYNKRSYILASDLYLWKQYYDFIKNNKRINDKFGCLKGQGGNYKCAKSNEGLRTCECKMSGYSWAQLYNPNAAEQYGFSCARRCKYIKERKKALKSRVTLMTYSLFFFVVDVNNDDENVPIFDHRDVLFCDECHNIPSIVQMQYTPSIKYNDVEYLCKIYEYAAELGNNLFASEDDKMMLDPEIAKKYFNTNDLKKDWDKIWDSSKNFHTSLDEDWENINNIKDFFEQFTVTKETIKENIVSNLKTNKSISLKEKDIYKDCLNIERYLLDLNSFLFTISMVGRQYLVKQINQDISSQEIISVDFHCAKEDYMVYQYLLKKTPYKVLVSATIGDQESYEENIGIKYYEKEDSEIEETSFYKRIPSTFDFTKSPIYFINKFNMGFRDRDNSLRQLKPILYKLLDSQLKDFRGIIQTGSYQIAQDIIKDAPLNIKQRFLYYNGSREKTDVITMHELCDNTILIGPTLNEGIDLPGDKCRFILILKVPYPQLKDRLVDAKMKLFPLWYNYTTSNIIIQGIGRGNRFKDDWCITYIFDSCFFNLYTHTKDQYPQEIQERIKII